MAKSNVKLAAQVMLGVTAAAGLSILTGIVPIEALKARLLPGVSSQTAGENPKAEKKLAVSVEQETQTPAVEAQPKPDAGTNGNESQQAAEPSPIAPVVPAFDVLRVEANGSILAAGRASGNATVELLSEDGQPIGKSAAGPEGDFVILPDQPLAPGSYVLSLRATGPDGKIVTSEETGVIQIPEPGGEVLAMVSAQGKASRIISKPQAPDGQAAKTDSEAQGDAQAAQDDGAVKEADSSAEGNSQKSDATEVAAAEPPNVNEASSASTTTTGDGDPSAQGASQETPATAGDGDAAADGKKETDLTVETATATQSDQSVSAQTQPASDDPGVVVEAVEVENGEIYIAGAVASGSLVRVYIDNQPIGVARGTADNRFLLSKAYELAEGQHTVRADVLQPGSGKVVARAEVPLLHEVQIAALEQKASGNNVPQQQVKAEAPAQPNAVGQTATPETTVSLQQESAQPVVRETASAQPESIVGNKASDAQANEPVKPDQPAASTTIENQADNKSQQQAAAAQLETDGTSQSAPAINQEQSTNPETPVATTTTTETQQPQPGRSEPEGEATPPSNQSPAEGTVGASDPATDAVEPIRTGRAIIIKPGDNLWRISRNTYGRGIRYTTIYNANRDQIRNPNRIYIGQIFKIPEKAVE